MACLWCVCSLLIQLARDMQSDLHPHFGHLFVTLASLLHTQDTKCIEVRTYVQHCMHADVYMSVYTYFLCLVGLKSDSVCTMYAGSVHLPGLPAQVPLEATD